MNVCVFIHFINDANTRLNKYNKVCSGGFTWSYQPLNLKYFCNENFVLL